MTGSSFKCALRRLMVAYVLAHMDKMFSNPPSDRVSFKSHEAFAAYSAVNSISEAWNLVLRRVALKLWLKTGLLTLQLVQEVKDLLGVDINTVEKALKPERGSAT